jgi:HK97 gp10 family phage protein
MEFKLEGLNSLMKKLDDLGGSISTATISGVNKTLQDITTTAKENAAVDTGQLRESIESYGDEHKAVEKDGVVSGAAGTNLEYGPYVELGTGPVGESTAVEDKYPGAVAYTQKGWTYYSEKLGCFIHTLGQPAQPFLYPASQVHAKELPVNIKKAAEAEIRRLAK